jgi:hypothetical protein
MAAGEFLDTRNRLLNCKGFDYYKRARRVTLKEECCCERMKPVVK